MSSGTRSETSRTGLWRDDGAAAVEFALLFPVFMTLALGTMAAGMAYSKQINVTQAAREASRYGATYDIAAAGGIDPWLVAVDKAATESAGPPNPLGGYDYRCVAYVFTDASGNANATKSKHLEQGGTPTAGACPGTTRQAKVPSTDYVQVAIARRTSFFVLFANPTLQLDGLSFTPYEGVAPP